MSRFRLYPDAVQEQQLLTHCGHARYVWNLAVEQLSYRARHQNFPSAAERSRQLTEARHEFEWLSAGSVTVQQQALRDFEQALRSWWAGTHKRPTWRKRGRNEGFRVVDGHGIRVEQLNRKWSRAWIPRVGWAKFRRSQPIPDARSFRVTLDSAGRWHIAFAVIPSSIDGPGDQSIIGVDRGVAVTLVYSNGTMLHAPQPTNVKGWRRSILRSRVSVARRVGMCMRTVARAKLCSSAQPADTPATPT
jgi:transposase